MLNRLWVRLSLIIVGVGLLILGSAFTIEFASRLWESQSPVSLEQEVAEAIGQLPDETVARLRERMAQNATRAATTVIISASIIGVVAGVLLSRSLTAPLQKLETAANAIKAYDYKQRVPVEGSQELVAVATAFNAMAERLDESETLRRNLLADVAHELRHPLHVLQGNLHAILDGVYELSEAEIGRLLTQTQHLTTLVNDLHELAQAEAHQLPLHLQPVAIGELVKETAVSFKPTAAAKTITLTVELLGAMPTLQIDPQRLRQVLNNLLSNALRYSEPGGHIVVSVEQQPPHLLVRVRDDGQGIAPDKLPYVFDRFYRGDTARSRGDGIGLGLAIAMAIVEQHEGELTAVSAGLSHGSTFTISLPLR